MASFGVEPKMSLNKFVFMYPLPQCAKVIEGYQDPYNDDNEFSANDVIEIRRVTCPSVDLTFHRPPSVGGDVLVRLSTDIKTLRFRLSDSDRKLHVFHGVEELIDKRPLYVKAIGVSASPNLPAALLKGERLRIVGVEAPQTACKAASMLELKTSSMQIVRLPLDYAGNFQEVVDHDRLYTLEELAWLGSVTRTLTVDLGGLDQAELPSSIPVDYQGDVNMAPPQLLVDVHIKNKLQCSSSGDESDDHDDDEDDDRGRAGEEDKVDSFLVPIDSEILVSPRPEDYESLIDEQFTLQHLPSKMSSFTDVFRVLSWSEETPVLQYHSIKPGDRLVFYEKLTVRKLLATANKRFFFIPVSHKGQFTLLDDSSNGLPVMLSELASDTIFPFRMKHQKCMSVSADPELPEDASLLVHRLVLEEAVLAAKIYEQKTFPAFRLPLRTRITVGVERGSTGETKRNIIMSDSDSYAEEINEETYNYSALFTGKTSTATIKAPRRPPSTHRRKSSEAEPPATFTSSPKQAPPPVKPRTANSTIDPRTSTAQRSTSFVLAASAVESVLSKRLMEPGEVVEQQTRPPLVPRRSSTDSQPTTRLKRLPDRPRLALPSDDSPVTVTSSTQAVNTESGRSEYSYATEDIMWREIGLSLFNRGQHVSVPTDCDVSGYSTEQLLSVMRILDAPRRVIQRWYELGIDGRAFAALSDDDLRLYEVDQPLVRQLRNCSRDSLRKCSPEELVDPYVTLKPNRKLQ